MYLTVVGVEGRVHRPSQSSLQQKNKKCYMNDLSKRIRSIIAKGKLLKAIEFLNSNVSGGPLLDELVLLESRLNRINEQERQGTITVEDEAVALNKISTSILRIVELIEDEVRPVPLNKVRITPYSKEIHLKCQVCETEFRDGDKVILCPDCQLPYHCEENVNLDCWTENLVKYKKCINPTCNYQGVWGKRVVEDSPLIGMKCPICALAFRTQDWVVLCPCKNCNTYVHFDIEKGLACYDFLEKIAVCPSTDKGF